MIISYEIRSMSRHGNLTSWVECCGRFDSWDAFESFKSRERDNRREVQNAKEETA